MTRPVPVHRRLLTVALAVHTLVMGPGGAPLTASQQGPAPKASALMRTQTPEAALAEARRLTEALEYEQALQVLDSLIPRTELVTGDAGRALRIAALELRGRVRFSLGTQGAAEDFRQLLSLAPSHTLPPQVSPRIVELFEDIRRGERGSAAGGPAKTAAAPSATSAPAAAKADAAKPASSPAAGARTASTGGRPAARTAAAARPPAPEPAPAPPVILADGTRVTVRLLEEVSSARAGEGDVLTFEVMEDITVDGQLLIRQGTPARGTVVEAQARRRMGRAGRLSYAVTETRALDNRTVRLRATRVGAGGSAVGSTAAATAGVALLAPVAAPFMLLRRGRDITVPVGTRIDAFVDGDHRFP